MLILLQDIFTAKEFGYKSLITEITYVIIDESSSSRLLVVFGGMLIDFEITSL